mmetsp:Transcript_14655/g.24000  ORF Transcript_14655/g.24000 Transcript_14655/m.24000 type:complete len:725 (+) Transcript_14655:213-2387(+)
MRQNRAVALLLLSIGSSVKGFSKSQHPVISHEGTSLSPLRVASTAWATSNDSGSNEQRRRQKAKAPLVDSTLLRFLSSQKNSGPVLLEDDRPTAPANGGGGNTISITSPIKGDSRGSSSSSSVVDLPTFASENRIDQAELEQTFASTTATIPDDNSNILEQPQPGNNEVIENQTWLSQYNAQRVTLKLLSLGVENEAAANAGRIVQNYALARVTRRRIRKFLQERDAAWESGSTAPLVDRSGIKESISALAAGKFDIDGVISVMTEYGLTGADVAAIFSHTPSIAMMQARSTVDESAIGTGGEAAVRTSVSVEQTLERAFVNLLGERLKLRRYDARKVLRTCPGLLTSKGSKSADQVVNLMVSLGTSTNSLARDKSTLPTLLSRSPALIFRLVAFLTSAQLKLPLNAIGPILRQKQSAEMLNAVAPLKRTISLGENANNGQTMMDSTNNITSFNMEEGVRDYLRVDNTLRQQKIDESYRSMEAVADVLRRSAGIRDFRKILSSYPDAFFLNVTNIHHVASYLREDVGMTKDDVAKAIQTFPSLLKQDVTRIKDVVDFLRSIEVDEEDLPSILRSFPATLLLDIEKDMVPVVDFIRGIGVRNIGRFVTRLPPVLGYSVEKDLQPKWDFLAEVCQFDYFEVARFPAYFSYPLDRVIKLRYEYLRDCKGIPIQLARVDDVLRFGDREFATEIALDDDNGAAFAKFAEERDCSLRMRKNRRKPRRRHH